MHWNWDLVLTGSGVFVAFAGLVLTGVSMILKRIDRTDAKNDLQLAQQRRITRDLFGEDPDNPSGHKGPTLRELVTGQTVTLADVAANTRGLADRMVSAESRLGKLEDEVSFIKDEILRRSPGS